MLLPKLHRAIAPGGLFLVWRNVFGHPDVITPFRERVAQIVAGRGGPPRPGPDAEEITAASAALTGSGLFFVHDTATFRWSIELDDEGVRGLFATFSDWSTDEAARAAAAVRELGGTVVEHYMTWLIALKPLDVRSGGGR
ncbi:MAG TPA: hypothetical protein VFY91_14130 [Microbacterium sp.]|nr:hypothetical protein [Microbacterium sp.]